MRQPWTAHTGTTQQGALDALDGIQSPSFTDGAYALGSSGSDDAALGMGLLNVASGGGYTAMCQLIIDD